MVESSIGAIENVGFCLFASCNFAQQSACIGYDEASWLNPHAQLLVVLVPHLVDLAIELLEVQ